MGTDELDVVVGTGVIQDAAVHGIAELVQLFGIESPGLITASLAIAEEVVRSLA